MSSNDIKLEVCVDSIASALAAAEGGASRIELCSALTEGGLTPSPGTLKAIKDLVNIPIYCMLRPRRGNDFVYSKSEMNAVLLDLDILRAHGADGFVFGALTKERTIDVEKCQRVVERAGGMPLTFHRAFDLTNPQIMHDTVTLIKELGFKRLLSSGFRATAIEGSEHLAQLVAKHRNIIITPGAGISLNNLDELLTITKCIEFHASAQSAAGTSANGESVRMDCDVTMGKQDVEPYSVTDVDVVRNMFEIQNLKLSNVNSINKKEIDELTQQLNESKALIVELNEKLKLTEKQETLISELKAKAAQFEEYIKMQRSVHSPTALSPPSQLPTNDDNKRQESNRLHTAEIKQIEARIRDEMSKLFASEIKRFQIKLHQTEEKNICLQHEYERARNDLQQRQTEVELLKQAILAEREHIKEVLNIKDAEAHLMLEKQTAILHKCRDELLAKNQRVVQLSKELEERQMQIEAERQSMKAVMMQWEEQRKHVDAIESEWKDKVKSLSRAHEKALAAWQKKYNSAKHTAANYKRYAEDKEAHMLREYDRLKTEYDASLTKIETRMKDALEKKNREMRVAIATIEKHHELEYDKENRNKN